MSFWTLLPPEVLLSNVFKIGPVSLFISIEFFTLLTQLKCKSFSLLTPPNQMIEWHIQDIVLSCMSVRLSVCSQP